MSATLSVARQTSVSLEQAKEIVADANAEPMLWAAANTIISLHQAVALLGGDAPIEHPTEPTLTEAQRRALRLFRGRSWAFESEIRDRDMGNRLARLGLVERRCVPPARARLTLTDAGLALVRSLS